MLQLLEALKCELRMHAIAYTFALLWDASKLHLICLQADKKGSTDTGPKSWSNSPTHEESTWSSWVLPMTLALVASIIYRVYFS